MQLLNIALVVLCCCTGVAHGQAKGEECTNTCDSGLECQEGKCRVKIDGACVADSTEDCVVTAAACPAGATCVCPTDATANADKTECTCDDGNKVIKGDKTTCVLKAGETGCSAGDCLDDATCNSGTCECDANFVASTDNTTCMKKAEQPCTVADDCLTGATCEGTPKMCTCPNGANDDKTKCRAKIGEACTATSTDECVETAAACPAGATCVCPTGASSSDDDTVCSCTDDKVFKGDMSKCVLKANQTGCSDAGDCLDDATCNAQSTCECGANFVASDDNAKCLKKAEQSCNDATECLTGAACEGSPKKCTCPNGANEDKTKCTGGASAVMASLTLLLAALAVSLRM